jgi:hypothetical protein
MKSILVILLSSFTLLSFSCREKEPPIPPACEDTIGLDRVDASSENYISGTIDGHAFYYGDNGTPFRPYASTIYIVEGGGAPVVSYSFGLEDTLITQRSWEHIDLHPGFNLYFMVNTSEDLEQYEVFDKYLIPGELLIADDKTTYDNVRMSIYMQVLCGSLTGNFWQSLYGPQEGSYFRVLAVNRTDNGQSVTYKVNAEFSMTVYKNKAKSIAIPRISDGKVQLTFTVYKLP